MFRTDENNNPAAVATAVAAMGLIEGKEWVYGEPFGDGSGLVTAKLIGDPIALTIKLIDAVGYYTKLGLPRWNYIAIPGFDWHAKTFEQKRDIIGFHYQREGGTAMQRLFPKYGLK